MERGADFIMGFLFKPELIPKIITGAKWQSRRLWKDGTAFVNFTPTDTSNRIQKLISFPNLYILKEVGRDYAVQPGRGKPGVWYCPKCNFLMEELSQISYSADKPITCGRCKVFLNSLRIRVLKIRKERLFDISEEDAKAEGFSDEQDFLAYFYSLYWNTKVPEEFKGHCASCCTWNPWVAAYDFEVFK